jgi:hypothetical protein
LVDESKKNDTGRVCQEIVMLDGRSSGWIDTIIETLAMSMVER